MKEEDQRIAIAEACGWRVGPLSGIQNGWGTFSPDGATFSSYWVATGEVAPTMRSRLSELPDYLSDLNAMHEAEKILTRAQQFHFDCYLFKRCVPFDEGDTWEPQNAFYCIHATAAQRAEAFLRTLNLWKDS